MKYWPIFQERKEIIPARSYFPVLLNLFYGLLASFSRKQRIVITQSASKLRKCSPALLVLEVPTGGGHHPRPQTEGENYGTTGNNEGRGGAACPRSGRHLGLVCSPPPRLTLTAFFNGGTQNWAICARCVEGRGKLTSLGCWLFSDVLTHILASKVTAATVLFLGQSREI